MENIQTYKYKDKNYKLSDFQEGVGDGWEEYRTALKDEEKNRDALNQAYNYMLDGIANGTVTIKNGNFYTTDQNILNNKDIFGQVTYYLKSQLGKSEEYISPEEKRKVDFSNDAFRKNFNNYVFNSDDFNLNDFIELDPLDEKTGKRGTTNRINAIKEYLDQIDFDRDFKNLDEPTKARYQKYIENAKKAISDNTISSNEYLDLSRLFGYGGQWNKIFTTERTPAEPDKEETPVQEAPAQQTPQQLLDNFMVNEIPEFTGQESEYELNTPKFGRYTFQIWENIMKNINNKDLVRMMDLLNDNPNINLSNMKYVVESAKKTGAAKLRIAYPNNAQSRSFVLNTMKYRNLLTKIGDGLYMYYSNRSPYALIWDEKQNKLYKKAARNVEYIVKSKLNEFNQTNGNTEGSWYKKYQQPDNTSEVESAKNGGVLKASGGLNFNLAVGNNETKDLKLPNGLTIPLLSSINPAKLPDGGFDDFNQAVIYNDEDLLDSNRLKRVWNKETGKYELAKRGDQAATDNISTGNKLYDVEGVEGSQEKDENLYKVSWNENWINRLMNNPKLAEAFARRYISLNGVNGDKFKQLWFNPDDTFNHENFKKAIPRGDEKIHIWSEGLNGTGHDVYAGRMYGIATGDGSIKYYNHIPEGWQISGDKIKFDDITNLYMLTPKSGEQKVENQDQAGERIPGKENIKDLNIKNPYDDRSKENSLALLRLIKTLNNNRKNANILRNGITLKQYDTYETYAPIKGAYSIKSTLANQAADIQSRMANQGFVDWKQQALANSLAQSQADQYNEKGIASDVQERQRTEAISRELQERNLARRQNVADKDIDENALYRQQFANIDASRNIKDNESQDTYIKQIEEQSRLDRIEKQNKYDDYIQKVIAGRVSEKYTDKINAIQAKFDAWAAENPQIAKEPALLAVAPEYKEYKRAMKNLQNMQAADLAEVYMTVTGEQKIPNDPWSWKKELEKLNHTILNKNGGILIPKNKFLK